MKEEETHNGNLTGDLYSIQEVRNLIKRAKAAQEEFASFSQEQVDAVCRAVAEAGRKTRKSWPRWPRKRRALACGRTRC